MNGIREEHCVHDPRRIAIEDVILGNTRQAQAAGFAVVGGQLENEVLRREREAREVQASQRKAQQRAAQLLDARRQQQEQEALLQQQIDHGAHLLLEQEKNARRQEREKAQNRRKWDTRAISTRAADTLERTAIVMKEMVSIAEVVCAVEADRAKSEGRAQQGLKAIQNTFLDGAKSIRTQARELDKKQHDLLVMVFGEGKNGKSTVLNALLGEELLPSGQLKLTGNLTVVQTIQDGEKCCPLLSLAYKHFRKTYRLYIARLFPPTGYRVQRECAPS